MQDINKTTLIGRLTKDAALRTFDSGSGVIQFTLAVNTSRKEGDKFVDYGNFFPVKYYGKKLDKLTSMLVKGKQIAISGYLSQERWEKDGKQNSSIVVIAQDIQLVGGGGSSQSNDNQEQCYDGPIQEDFPPF